jgi:hypothetical protein
MYFAYGTKKKLRNVVIGLFFLFGGIEYGWYKMLFILIQGPFKYLIVIFV